MCTPVIVWIAIIGLFAAIVIICLTTEMVRLFHKGHSHRIFSLGTERELFFVPGDPKDEEEDRPYDKD